MPVLDLIVVVVFAVTLALVARAVRGVVVEAISQAVDVGAFDAGELADGAAADAKFRNVTLFCTRCPSRILEHNIWTNFKYAKHANWFL